MLAALSFQQHCYAWILSYYFCAGLMFLGQFHRAALSLIRFLWSEAVSGAPTHHRLPEQYGNSILPQQSVYEWTGNFKNVRTSVTSKEGTNFKNVRTSFTSKEGTQRLFAATNEDNSECACDMAMLG
jgi:hypothetical protein